MLTITKMKIKFLGKTDYVFRMFKGSELIGVYATVEEAEAAKAAK